MLKRMVIATDEENAPIVIGPVFKTEALEKICDEVEDRGWTLQGTALVMSAAQFRAEGRADR